MHNVALLCHHCHLKEKETVICSLKQNVLEKQPKFTHFPLWIDDLKGAIIFIGTTYHNAYLLCILAQAATSNKKWAGTKLSFTHVELFYNLCSGAF